MSQINSVPFIFLVQVWSSHPDKFYEDEAKWLLKNLGGRLRKQAFRDSQDLGLSIIQYLFETEWFRSVKRVRSGAVILERKRGQVFFGIHLEDIPKIRRWAMRRRENDKVFRLRSA